MISSLSVGILRSFVLADKCDEASWQISTDDSAWKAVASRGDALGEHIVYNK